MLSILTNEKYKGDALLQKYYTEDFLTKKTITNTGAIQQYYVEGDHEAIIPPETFELVQQELVQRKQKKGRYSGVDIFASRIVCAECGGYYGAKVWHSNNAKYRRVVYRCNGKYSGGHKCRTPHVTEEQMQQLFVVAVNRLIDSKDEVIEVLKETGAAVFDTSELETEEKQLSAEMNMLADMIQSAIRENAHVALDQTEFQQRYNELADRYERVKQKHDEIEQTIAQKLSAKVASQQFISEMEKLEQPITEFRRELWGTLLDHATVHSQDDIRFTFRNGTEIKA